MLKIMFCYVENDATKATGFCHWYWKNSFSEEFIHLAFNYVGLDYKRHIKIDKKLFRPNDKIILR